jgi:hypothetical protein
VVFSAYNFLFNQYTLMKKLLTLLLLGANSLFAQKVDLDRSYFNVEFQTLPKRYLPIEKRTYGVHVKAMPVISNVYPETRIYDNIKVDGLTKVEASPAIGIDVVFEDFAFTGNEIKKETITEKDNNGNVKSSTTYYWLDITYSARGHALIKAPFAPTKTELASAQQKQEVKATNRFLVNTEFKKPEETSGDEKNYSFTKLVHYVGQKSTSSVAAQREYDSLKQRLFEQTLRNYVQNSINELNGFLVENFGFYTVKKEDFLWILDAKTDEGKTQSEAIEAVRMLFKEMKASESTESLEKQLQPLIDYFESLKKKYTENDKGSRKMRYSAYYNLGKIYYYLDKPEKVIKEAQGLIDNDYDTRDGKILIFDAEQLKIIFDESKYNTRHNPSPKL